MHLCTKGNVSKDSDLYRKTLFGKRKKILCKSNLRPIACCVASADKYSKNIAFFFLLLETKTTSTLTYQTIKKIK